MSIKMNVFNTCICVYHRVVEFTLLPNINFLSTYLVCKMNAVMYIKMLLFKFQWTQSLSRDSFLNDDLYFQNQFTGSTSRLCMTLLISFPNKIVVYLILEYIQNIIYLNFSSLLMTLKSP